MNELLRDMREFCRTYIDDIMIFSRFLEKHLRHLSRVFQLLKILNICLNSNKTYLTYSIIALLEQKIDNLSMITVENKLKAIVNLQFSRILKNLETYLKMTNHLRNYISFYAQKFESLQVRKILLLKDSLIKKKSRQVFFKKILLNESFDSKIESYEQLR